MNNYPIKYAPMPVIKNNKVVAYITAKVYLLEETKKYLGNGECNTTYLIFYIYDQYGQRQNLILDDEDTCVNGYEIDFVFDDINSCKTFTRNKNAEIVLNETHEMNNINDINNYYKINKERFNEYYNLEESLLTCKIIDFKAKKRMINNEK